MKKNFFERYPRLTVWATLLIMGLIGILCLEVTAKKLFGLGNVIVYQSHPIYGFRPYPNQLSERGHGTKIQINNLSLRSEEDWALKKLEEKQKRVLFLGDSVTYGGSYVDNKQLFSHLAVKETTHCISANAGVNAWGVMNIHGLVKEMDFTPADIYVTVLPEGDFYRGLNRIGGQPFWSVKPKWALEELLHYFLYKLSFRKNPELSITELPEKERALITDVAARHLKSMDDHLTSKKFRHLVYITPSRSQVFGEASIDPLVNASLKKYGIKAVYLFDKLGDTKKVELTPSIYHDEIHLSQEGHKMWAKMIEEDLRLYCH